jgi:hypothetical protein
MLGWLSLSLFCFMFDYINIVALLEWCVRKLLSTHLTSLPYLLLPTYHSTLSHMCLWSTVGHRFSFLEGWSALVIVCVCRKWTLLLNTCAPFRTVITQQQYSKVHCTHALQYTITPAHTRTHTHTHTHSTSLTTNLLSLSFPYFPIPNSHSYRWCIKLYSFLYFL